MVTTTSAVSTAQKDEVTQFAGFLDGTYGDAREGILGLVRGYLLKETYDRSTRTTTYSGPLMEADVELRKRWLHLEMRYMPEIGAFSHNRQDIVQRYMKITREHFYARDFSRHCASLQKIWLEIWPPPPPGERSGELLRLSAEDLRKFRDIPDVGCSSYEQGGDGLGDAELAAVANACQKTVDLKLWWGNFSDLSPLAGLSQLQTLHLSGLSQVPKNVHVLKQLTNLRELSFSINICKKREKERLQKHLLTLREQNELLALRDIPQLTEFRCRWCSQDCDDLNPYYQFLVGNVGCPPKLHAFFRYTLPTPLIDLCADYSRTAPELGETTSST